MIKNNSGKVNLLFSGERQTVKKEDMAVLKVTYKIRAHHISSFENLFLKEIFPLTQRHGLNLLGFWRTLIGNAGEYLELWEFKSVSDFEESWKNLLKDPELKKIFQRTGPMVEAEHFSLLEPVNLKVQSASDVKRQLGALKGEKP